MKPLNKSVWASLLCFNIHHLMETEDKKVSTGEFWREGNPPGFLGTKSMGGYCVQGQITQSSYRDAKMGMSLFECKSSTLSFISLPSHIKQCTWEHPILARLGVGGGMEWRGRCESETYMFVLRSHISTAPSLTHPKTVAEFGDHDTSMTAFCIHQQQTHTNGNIAKVKTKINKSQSTRFI